MIGSGLLAALALTASAAAVPAVPAVAAETAATTVAAVQPQADRVLRVYNNIENLIRNNPDGTCTQPELGDLKKKQTNAIIYDTRRPSLAAEDISKYWSAGWLKPGRAYNDGAGLVPLSLV